jgi:glycosyltransferase involved in cell wall biosynthesis
MKFLIICDPPVGKSDANVGGTHGVIGNLRGEFEALGHQVELITGDILYGVPPGESGYPLVCELLDKTEFDQIHLVTQARLGLLVREYCIERGLKFTAAYHTQIPEYLEVRHGMPKDMGYGYMKWFLNAAERVIVPTPEMAQRLRDNGCNNVVSCLHGVNTDRFRPRNKGKAKKKTASQPHPFCPCPASLGNGKKHGMLAHLPGPLWLFVGRLVPEKNLEGFLSLDLPGTKVVVGDGPLRASLEAKYPGAYFAGVQTGDALAEYYADCDCFVFPSLTDTFGLVLLEAMAAGLPCAAFPVTGPIDVVTDPRTGVLDNDLAKAALAAIKLDPKDCRAFALQHSWTEAAKRFLSHQVDAGVRRGIVAPGNPYLSHLEHFVTTTELLLFGPEPAGPFAKGAR